MPRTNNDIAQKSGMNEQLRNGRYDTNGLMTSFNECSVVRKKGGNEINGMNNERLRSSITFLGMGM